MVSCRLQLQTYLIIKNIQARTLIMIPDYVHLNPIALFYLFMVYLQTLPLHMVDTQQIGKHVHGSKS
jgi:hypothetical protein